MRGSRNLQGQELLLAHCAALSQFGNPRAPVVDRLRVLLGEDLTRFLIVALAGDHRMRSRRLAA
jgi:hypothetical protein